MNYGVCLEMVFTDRPFLDRIHLAAEAGFSFAEMWFGDLTTTNSTGDAKTSKQAAKIRAAAEKAGITMTNVVIGSPDGGIGSGLTDAARRPEWLQRTDATLAYCRDANIGAAIVCTGNLVEGLSRAPMRQNVLDGLKATAERAEKAGITLLLEALNDKVDHPGYFLTSSDEGAALCREVNSPRLKLLFDCYHMQIMEGDLTGHLRKNMDVIGHIHSAGHPGRHELWLGETNYPLLVREIESMGYRGVFALEYTPTLLPSESLRRTLAYLKG
ncbi:MAG: TIM barrel protein [Verrucomicrobia bacterium]|nr:TIM barrel protein [Verrucomicrobiota bacterium]MBU1734260.1 TIM barrel protein [Verrucomicrobiota bacterium]MBU1856158.1 TIM barrel protein [Verrucomicrobiota bacterium]